MDRCYILKLKLIETKCKTEKTHVDGVHIFLLCALSIFYRNAQNKLNKLLF